MLLQLVGWLGNYPCGLDFVRAIHQANPVAPNFGGLSSFSHLYRPKPQIQEYTIFAKRQRCVSCVTMVMLATKYMQNI